MHCPCIASEAPVQSDISCMSISTAFPRRVTCASHLRAGAIAPLVGMLWQCPSNAFYSLPCRAVVTSALPLLPRAILWWTLPPLAIRCFVRASSLCRRRFHYTQYSALYMPLASAGPASIGRYTAVPTCLQPPKACFHRSLHGGSYMPPASAGLLPSVATRRFIHSFSLHRQRFHRSLHGASYMPPASTGSASVGRYTALPTCLLPPQERFRCMQ